MRRSVEEGVNSRFVTGDRVQAVIKVSLSYIVHLSILSSTNIGNASFDCVWRH